MNVVNHAATSIFDILLTPLELMGQMTALILVSGIFGILALIIFKHISWQAGIKGAKDKIKGDMIAIRLYQDDLAVVSKSVGKVFLRNFQYLGLNFGPILPLLVPFILVAAQFVVRYAFEPVPVTELEGQTSAELMSGRGLMIEVAMKDGREGEAMKLTLEYPEGIEPITPLVRNADEGVAFQEVIATQSVEGEILFRVDGKDAGAKQIVAGDERARMMQPERVSSFWLSWMWPAEDTFGADNPIGHVTFAYPLRSYPFLPDGPLGVILLFFLASIVFGVVVLKPLNIQI